MSFFIDLPEPEEAPEEEMQLPRWVQPSRDEKRVAVAEYVRVPHTPESLVFRRQEKARNREPADTKWVPDCDRTSGAS